MSESTMDGVTKTRARRFWVRVWLIWGTAVVVWFGLSYGYTKVSGRPAFSTDGDQVWQVLAWGWLVLFFGFVVTVVCTGKTRAEILVGAAGVLVTVACVAVLALAWVGISGQLRRIQARQDWALVVFAAGGDPIEFGRWIDRDSCERQRQQFGREYYERGVAVGLKCQGVKSWWELLRARDRARAPLRLEDLK
jgi:hypothetical protein